jgi:hypothetical protein
MVYSIGEFGWSVAIGEIYDGPVESMGDLLQSRD